MKFQYLINQVLVIGIAVVLRLLPHPPNFAPIAAMALFGGAYFDRKYALVIPLTALLVSDFFLGFHNTMLFVYGSFLISGMIGMWLKKHRAVTNVVLASLSSSVMFFIITNFGVWAVTDLYPKTINGLVTSYVMAIPFFRNTLLGDLFFSGLFFGGYEVVQKFVNVSLQREIRQNKKHIDS